MDLILLKNGKVKEFGPHKKFKYKSGQVLGVLVHVESPVLGRFYYLLSYKAYRDMKKKIKSITLKYRFLNNYDVDDGDDEMYTEYIHHFSTINEFFQRYIEILISEYSLNEYCWKSSAFYGFYYSCIKLIVKYHGKKKKKKMTPGEFIDYIGLYNREIMHWDKHIKVGDNKYKTFTDTSNMKGNMNLLHIFPQLFVEASKDVNDIVKIKRKSDLYVDETREEDLKKKKPKFLEDYHFGDNNFKINPKETGIKCLRFVFQIPMDHFIIKQVMADCTTYLRERVKVKLRGQKGWKSISYKKLIKMCFKL